MDKKGQANVINVWGLANIGCTMENVTFQTLVQGDDVRKADVVQEAETETAVTPDAKVQTAKPQAAPEVQESFADRVKAIVRKAACRNGQRIETSAKGHAGAYIYYIDAECFCQAMDDMEKMYSEKLKEVLGGSMQCVQVTKVCFFIAHVVRMHIINDTNLQMSDLVFAFEDYYDNAQTVKAKLGDRKTTSDQDVFLGTFEGLLKKHKA